MNELLTISLENFRIVFPSTGTKDPDPTKDQFAVTQSKPKPNG
jgi:hypothetical protein